MRQRCEEHNKEYVLAWIKKDEGHYSSRNVCPVCYNIKRYKFKCKKCGLKNDYLASKNCFPYRCLYCKDTGIIPEGSFHTSKIPSWRLKVDDATPMDLLKKPSSEFGMPSMSEAQWQEFYSQEHEVKHQKKRLGLIEKMKKEALGMKSEKDR